MRRAIVPTFVGLVLSLALVSAQDASQASVQVAENEEFGEHLVNAEGMSLYLYTEDEQGSEASVCGEACVRNWPPLTVEEDPVAGEGLDSELLGAFEREDGSTQVTYNGWPLYTYVRDSEAGHTKGQALGQVFFLVSPEGEQITEAVAQEGEGGEVTEEQMAAGQQVFATNCQVCHGAEGQGAIGPRLAGNDELEDTQFVVERIIHGFPEHGMPPFGHLSDEQIAAVSTYIRNSWENEFGPVTPEEVSEFR